MDENEFDRLSRAVGVTPSRRNFLRLLGGSAIGGFLGIAGVAVTYAGGKKCPPGSIRCGGGCCDTSGGDLVCRNGTCCLPPRCF